MRAIAMIAVVGVCSALSGVPALAQVVGAQQYSKACQRCHTVPQVLHWMSAYSDAPRRATFLDEKLTRHYARDSRVRAGIIAYLEAEYAKSANGRGVDVRGAAASPSGSPLEHSKKSMQNMPGMRRLDPASGRMGMGMGMGER